MFAVLVPLRRGLHEIASMRPHMPVFGPWALERPHRMPVEDFFGAGVVYPLPSLGNRPLMRRDPATGTLGLCPTPARRPDGHLGAFACDSWDVCIGISTPARPDSIALALDALPQSTPTFSGYAVWSFSLSLLSSRLSDSGRIWHVSTEALPGRSVVPLQVQQVTPPRRFASLVCGGPSHADAQSGSG